MLLEINRQPVRSIDDYRRLTRRRAPATCSTLYLYKPELRTARAAHRQDRLTVKPRILVIDDEARDPRLAADDPRVRGLSSSSGAATGQEGIAAVQRERPDLVLLDIKMPGHGRPRGAAPSCTRSTRRCPWSMISGHGTTATDR